MHSGGYGMVEMKRWTRLALGAHHDFIHGLGRGEGSTKWSADDEGGCDGANPTASTCSGETYDATRKWVGFEYRGIEGKPKRQEREQEVF